MGDKIEIGDLEFSVTGIGSVPDYDACLKEMSDSSVDSDSFGIGFVSSGQFEALNGSGSAQKAEVYTCAYRLNETMTEDELKQLLSKQHIKTDQVPDANGIENLISFLSREQNPRIGASSDDVKITRNAGMTAGVIVMILFTYVISVFVVHGIEQESQVIGTLYALGVKKKQLLISYLFLPAIVTLLGGVMGTALGFSPLGAVLQTQDSAGYFSLPVLKNVYPVSLFIYGLIMPAAVAVAVNWLVIGRKLSRPALKMIRKEQKQSGLVNIELGNMGFMQRFRIRQFLRESRSGAAVAFGMLISLLILMLGLDCFTVCRNLSEKSRQDIVYEYMYTLKYPMESVPEGGEACYGKTLKKEALGYDLDVTLLGIGPENPYFDFDVPDGENQAVLSDAAAFSYCGCGCHLHSLVQMGD